MMRKLYLTLECKHQQYTKGKYNVKLEDNRNWIGASVSCQKCKQKQKIKRVQYDILA